MRVKIRRPACKRNARLLLAAAFLIPAAGFVQTAMGRGDQAWADARLVLPLGAAVLLAALALLCIYDAFRWVVLVTRIGIGIAGRLGASTAWLAWPEIVSVHADGTVVCITTRGRQLYQLELPDRATAFLARMIERRLVRT